MINSSSSNSKSNTTHDNQDEDDDYDNDDDDDDDELEDEILEQRLIEDAVILLHAIYFNPYLSFTYIILIYYMVFCNMILLIDLFTILYPHISSRICQPFCGNEPHSFGRKRKSILLLFFLIIIIIFNFIFNFFVFAQ